VVLTTDRADLQSHVACAGQNGATVWKTARSGAWKNENVPGHAAKGRDFDAGGIHESSGLEVCAGPVSNTQR